jgi:hypothetical protein
MSAAAAVAFTAIVTVGTASAATTTVENGASASQGVVQNIPHRAAPHRFRARFRSQQECQVRARHDHPGRTADWECRRGSDHNNPWEYWGA